MVKDSVKYGITLYSSFFLVISINLFTLQKRFEILSKHHDEMKALGQLPPALITLSQLMPLPTVPHSQEDQKEAPVTGKTLEKQVEMLLRALNSAREQMATARNPQFSVLNRM